MDVPAISVRALTKRYGTQRAVDELTFDVAWGRVTGFLGPNGAGKTTTMRMILGLTRPTAGAATVAGRPYVELDAPVRTIGAALETTAFHPLRSGRNHLRVLAAAAGLRPARVDEVLALVELTAAAGKRVGGYSLGMRQRLSLAAALLGEPSILVLDEPANGLDPQGIHWLRDFLRSFAEGGGAVLVSSHLLGEVAQLADEVIVIDRGRFVVQARVDELSAGSGRTVRVRTPDDRRLLAALHAEGLAADRNGGGHIVVRDASAEQVGRIAARAGVVVAGLEDAAPSLEEVFLSLTSPGRREP